MRIAPITDAQIDTYVFVAARSRSTLLMVLVLNDGQKQKRKIVSIIKNISNVYGNFLYGDSRTFERNKIKATVRPKYALKEKYFFPKKENKKFSFYEMYVHTLIHQHYSHKINVY
jgi:hypothetical protein